MLKAYLLAATICVATAPCYAQAQVQAAVPGWQDLETAYARDGGISGAERQLTLALPAGMSGGQAVAALRTAGATCKPERPVLGGERCLIHQYSLVDGAADDIRWTAHLGMQSDRLSTVSLDRYVDCHGSN